jgi:galactokinase
MKAPITAADYFGGLPYVEASAPGRVNLLGEHTDYNDGFMLPVATPQRTVVRVGIEPGRQSVYYAADLEEQVSFDASRPAPSGFACYVAGCVHMLEARGVAVPTLRVHIESRVPLGAGLSSSAALEVAVLRALRKLLEVELDDLSLALLAQQAEIRYAGVQCGVMDQMASSMANDKTMLLIDARSLSANLLPLPQGSELIVIDSGVTRTLASSKYNERRQECKRAAALLGARSLRDVDDPVALAGLPTPLKERARHVLTENARVLEASSGVDAVRFGALMNASHFSLRDDYQVSIAALDDLTALLRSAAGVFGARLTGAGFGGACVALCREGGAAEAGRTVVDSYNAAPASETDAAGIRGEARLLIPALEQESGAA